MFCVMYIDELSPSSINTREGSVGVINSKINVKSVFGDLVSCIYWNHNFHYDYILLALLHNY